MKMRVQGDSIRFRLNRREVEQFVQSGRTSAALDFGGGHELRYTLAFSDASEVVAGFSGGEVKIGVPAAMARQWAATDEVAMTGAVALGAGRRLEVLVEKDFQCMHKGEGAKDPDAYPNPFAGA